MGRLTASLFARKPIESLLHDVSGRGHLHRALGPVALTSLGVGATLGAGIYVLTGEAARNDAGPSLILSFLLAGIGCGFAALCYSELASMVPVAGSAYTYAYATLGELIGWIIGWDLILEWAIGSAAVAVGWSKYLAALLRNQFHLAIDPRWLNSPWIFKAESHSFVWNQVSEVLADGSTVAIQPYANVPALLIMLAITVILVIGIRESAGFNALMVLLNLSVICLIIGLGATYIDPRNWRPFLHAKNGWSGVTLGAAHIFFAYIGFDAISTHAEEAKNPRRDLAIGIIASLLICTTLYIGVVAVLTGMVPYTQIDVNAPLATAFHQHGTNWAAGLIAGGIVAGMTSSLLVGTLSQPRIMLAMARDGLLPARIFAAIHPRFQTPWKSTILVGVTVGLIAALAPLDFLAELVSVGTLFAFLVVCAAVWVLRVRDPQLDRPFRVPGLPFVASAGILINGGLMFSLGPDNWIRLVVWLALGLIIYFAYGRYHSRLRSVDSQP